MPHATLRSLTLVLARSTPVFWAGCSPSPSEVETADSVASNSASGALSASGAQPEEETLDAAGKPGDQVPPVAGAEGETQTEPSAATDSNNAPASAAEASLYSPEAFRDAAKTPRSRKVSQQWITVIDAEVERNEQIRLAQEAATKKRKEVEARRQKTERL